MGIWVRQVHRGGRLTLQVEQNDNGIVTQGLVATGGMTGGCSKGLKGAQC